MTKEPVHVPVISEMLARAGIPLSPAVKAGGFVFVSGAPPIDLKTGAIVTGDIVRQTEASLENLKATLEAAGSSLDRVVKVTIFAANSAYYATINNAERYRREMAAPDSRHAIGLLAALSQTTDFSIGCYCEDESRCHRSILAELLVAAGAALADRRTVRRATSG
jgi:2-iminobutanoate/2-iminopropanoate deaminase